jgi:hypothetical protein
MIENSEEHGDLLKDKNDVTETLSLVRETKRELKKYREPYEKFWREYDDAYYGKQHKSGEDQKTVKNHIFKIIEGEVPILTDSMPGTNFTAHQEDRQGDADNLNKAVKFVYQDNNFQILLPTLVRSALRSAPGWLYIYNDPDANNGDGRIVFKQLDWENVYLDGNASLIEDAEKAVIEFDLRRAQLARTFPEHKEKIMKLSGGGAKSGGRDENYEARDVKGLNSDAGRPKKHSAKDLLKYTETWIKSYEMEAIDPEETQAELEEETFQLQNSEAPTVSKYQDHPKHIEAHTQALAQILAQLQLPPETTFEQLEQALAQMLAVNPQAEAQLAPLKLIYKLTLDHIEAHEHMSELNPTGERPKYEDGWRLIKSVGDVILFDGPNPEQNGEINLVPFYGYKDETNETIYGFGEIKNIIDAQRTLNEVDYKEYKNLKRVANSGWIADREAFPDDVNPNDLLTNEDGIVIVKSAGTMVERIPGGEVSPQLERRKTMDQMTMENISGVNEESQGTTSNAMSGVAIEKLQTQAVGRIRLKDRMIQHYSMKRVGKLTASFVVNHWSDEKQFRLRDENSNIETIVFDPMKMSDLEYTVEISVGSMAGISKDAFNGFLLTLVQSQIISPEDFLHVADFPKREILLKKLLERQQQQQQIQQVQQQAQEQMSALQQEAQGIQAKADEVNEENKALRQVMNPSEKRLSHEMLRQAALNHIQTQDQMANQGPGYEG